MRIGHIPHPPSWKASASILRTVIPVLLQSFGSESFDRRRRRFAGRRKPPRPRNPSASTVALVVPSRFASVSSRFQIGDAVAFCPDRGILSPLIGTPELAGEASIEPRALIMRARRMGVTRILDLIVLVLLATVLLMPRPDATVKPALTRRSGAARARRGAAVDADRPARRRRREPRARQHLSRRPSPGLGARDGDRVAQATTRTTTGSSHLRAIAYADRFEGEPAFEARAARGRAVRADAAAGGRARVRRGGAQPPGAARQRRWRRSRRST